VRTAGPLYGAPAFELNRRTYELGVRMALGAPGGVIVRLVLARHTLLPAGSRRRAPCADPLAVLRRCGKQRYSAVSI
jgi:hypothetical protein